MHSLRATPLTELERGGIKRNPGDITPGNTQVYSPFGTYVVGQHEAGWLQRYIDDIPPVTRITKRLVDSIAWCRHR